MSHPILSEEPMWETKACTRLILGAMVLSTGRFILLFSTKCATLDGFLTTIVYSNVNVHKAGRAFLRPGRALTNETYLFAESEMLVCVCLVGVLLRHVRSLAPHYRTAACRSGEDAFPEFKAASE